MNLKKIIACSLLCGILFSAIPAKAMDAPVNPESEVFAVVSESESLGKFRRFLKTPINGYRYSQKEDEEVQKIISEMSFSRNYYKIASDCVKLIAFVQSQFECSIYENIEGIINFIGGYATRLKEYALRSDFFSDEYKDYLSQYTCFIEILCEFYADFSGSRPYNYENIKGKLRALSSFGVPMFFCGNRDFISFMKILNSVKHLVVDNKLVGDDDVRNLNIAFDEIVDYQRSKRFNYDALLSILNDNKIDERISTSSLSDEQKRELLERFDIIKRYR